MEAGSSRHLSGVGDNRIQDYIGPRRLQLYPLGLTLFLGTVAWLTLQYWWQCGGGDVKIWSYVINKVNGCQWTVHSSFMARRGKWRQVAMMFFTAIMQTERKQDLALCLLSWTNCLLSPFSLNTTVSVWKWCSNTLIFFCKKSAISFKTMPFFLKIVLGWSFTFITVSYRFIAH